LSALRRRWDLRYGAAVAGVLAVALALRVWGLRSGLPWVYNIDEDQHFVPHAVAMLGGNLNPQYFGNPAAFTYVLAGLLELWFGGRTAVNHLYYSADSSQIWVLARLTSGVLGTLAVWLLYLVGARLFDRRTGLLAAAVMAVAFLPVYYGKLALNDAPTLAPVCLSLWGSVGILRDGRRRDYAIAGLGLGLAAATKYTGGIVIVPLAAAALSRVRGPDGGWRVALWLTLAGVVALAAFVAADPYSVVDFHSFWNALAHQSAESEAAGGKLGLTYGSGVFYYLWSITWGVGWVPALAALAGAALLVLRREWTMVAVWVPVVVVFLAFMGLQGRYFGRWVMPIVPIICLLGAHAAVSAAERLRSAQPRLRGLPVMLAGTAMCAQGLVYSIHSGLVNSRVDTRNSTLAWLDAHVPAHSRIVVEPVVLNSSRAPNNWAARWIAFPDFYTHRGPRGKLRVRGGQVVKLENYERTLSPALIDLYVRTGYCWVVTGSTEEARAQVDPTAVPQAVAYYSALAARGTLVYEVSPYSSGVASVPFNFDWSFDYYPAGYARPGPLIAIYRLHGGRCGRA
jgi:dolichyl-phosphate-mannose-protein mannosyltransferase